MAPIEQKTEVEKHLLAEDKLIQENACKTEALAKKKFPHETWDDASKIRLMNEGKEFEIPRDTKNITVAHSKLNGQKNDERTLAKEIRQGKILTDKNAVISLIPKLKDINGRDIAGPDAIVNGTLFEFKTITGTLGKVEKHFRNSREQSQNVFLRIMRPDISKTQVISKIQRILHDPTYTGGTKGKLIIHLEGIGRTYFLRIKDLK